MSTEVPGLPKRSDESRRDTSRVFVIVALAAIVVCSWLATENLRLRAATDERARTALTDVLQRGDRLPEIDVRTGGRGGVPDQAAVSIRRAAPGPSMMFVITSTCPFCARSMPALSELRSGLSDGQVALAVIALDGRLPDGAELPLGAGLLVPATPDDALALGVGKVPTLLLVGDDGVVRESWTGQLTKEKARVVLGAARRIGTK